MLRKNKTPKQLIFTFLITAIFGAFTLLSPISAQNNCPDNVVPNPLDPNCQLEQNQLSLGFIINRVVVFLPYIITFLIVAAIAYGAIKIVLAGDTDKRDEGFKIIINAIIGAVIFSSLWLILFLISLITGFNLVSLF